MGKIQLISEPKQKILKLLLEDHRINQMVLTNGEIPKSIVINDDGSVTFGRTPKHWWNYLFRDYKTLSFSDLAFGMLRAYQKYTPTNVKFFDTVSQEILDHAIQIRDYDKVIDRFMIHAFLGVAEGDYKLETLKIADSRQQPNNTRNNQGKRGNIVADGVVYIDLGGGQIPLDLHIEQ